MSENKHGALIHFSMDLIGGLEKIRYILQKLSESGVIRSTSSVYKRYLTDEKVDLSSRLEVVIRFETQHSVDQVLHLLMAFCVSEEHGTRHRGVVEIILLAFDNLVFLSPRLTLPYPQLHQDPLVIRCAAEAWGQYEHPIFERNLSEISKNAPAAHMAEFLMQGKSLVDF